MVRRKNTFCSLPINAADNYRGKYIKNTERNGQILTALLPENEILQCILFLCFHGVVWMFLFFFFFYKREFYQRKVNNSTMNYLLLRKWDIIISPRWCNQSLFEMFVRSSHVIEHELHYRDGIISKLQKHHHAVLLCLQPGSSFTTIPLSLRTMEWTFEWFESC